MKACIILHNIVAEDERNTDNTHFEQPTYDKPLTTTINQPQYNHSRIALFDEWLERNIKIHSSYEYQRLQLALIEHIWKCYEANYHGN